MIANIAPQTASSHLTKLVQGRLLTVEQQGRHRYYRLANAEIGQAVESLMAITAQPKRISRQLSAGGAPDDSLASARTCYSHLAGRLAVNIAEALQQRGVLVRREPKLFGVTKSGREWFARLGIETAERQLKDPRFARCCLDWTERRHHIAGHLGTAMLMRFKELNWIAPVRGSRAIRVTLEGERRLWDLLRVNGRGHS